MKKITKRTTEKQLRKMEIPFFNTKEELIEFIDSLDNLNNDYGTATYAMGLAGTAAFNYIAHKFGTTGFQASYAAIDMYGRVMHVDGPFMVIRLEDYIYPQYNLHEKLDNFIKSQIKWIKKEAKLRLINNPSAHVNVKAHWKMLSKLKVEKNDNSA